MKKLKKILTDSIKQKCNDNIKKIFLKNIYWLPLGFIRKFIVISMDIMESIRIKI